MRSLSPVSETRSAALGTRFWSVTGWAAMRSMLADDESYVSRYGVFLGFGPDRPDPAGGRMLVVTDGAPRKALRDAMRSFFTPRKARSYDTILDDLFAEHLIPRLDGGPFDFATEVAWRAPMLVACAILGVPAEDADAMCALANGVLTMHDPDCSLEQGREHATRARSEILAYFTGLTASPAIRAGDHLTARLLEECDAQRLTSGDVLINLLSMLIAANETTRLALTGAMVAFADEPDQFALLRADPDLIGPAIEEILRYTSPGMNISRTAARNTVLRGARISAGEVVTAWLPAGNRDPAFFSRPDVFDICRTPRPQLAFGHGPHHCIGSALARAELAALLRILRQHVAGIEVAGELVSTHSNAIWGYAHAPIKIYT